MKAIEKCLCGHTLACHEAQSYPVGKDWIARGYTNKCGWCICKEFIPAQYTKRVPPLLVEEKIAGGFISDSDKELRQIAQSLGFESMYGSK